MTPIEVIDEIIADAEQDQRTNRMSTVSEVTLSWLRLARRRVGEEQERADRALVEDLKEGSR